MAQEQVFEELCMHGLHEPHSTFPRATKQGSMPLTLAFSRLLNLHIEYYDIIIRPMQKVKKKKIFCIVCGSFIKRLCSLRYFLG